MTLENRTLRQDRLLAPEKLARQRAVVIGIGAIGYQVARQLAVMNVGNLVLVDYDTIEPHNLGNQGYPESNLGKLKTQSACDTLSELNSDISIQAEPVRYYKALTGELRIGGQKTEDTVFCCVDSMEGRKTLHEWLSPKTDLFLDGRMGGEAVHVYTSTPKTKSEYESTLYTSEEVQTTGCSQPTTYNIATIAAGLLVQEYSKHLRGMPVIPHLVFDALAGYMGRVK